MSATIVLTHLSSSWVFGEMEVVELKTKKQLIQMCVEVSAFQRVTLCLSVLILKCCV